MLRSLQLLAVLILAAALGCTADEAPAPLPRTSAKIAVLTFLTGPPAIGLEHSIDWAAEVANQTELLPGLKRVPAYYDLWELVERGEYTTQGLDALAVNILADPEVVAGTGIFSITAMKRFHDAKVPFVSSVSTTSDVFRIGHRRTRASARALSPAAMAALWPSRAASQRPGQDRDS